MRVQPCPEQVYWHVLHCLFGTTCVAALDALLLLTWMPLAPAAIPMAAIGALEVAHVIPAATRAAAATL